MFSHYPKGGTYRGLVNCQKSGSFNGNTIDDDELCYTDMKGLPSMRHLEVGREIDLNQALKYSYIIYFGSRIIIIISSKLLNLSKILLISPNSNIPK